MHGGDSSGKKKRPCLGQKPRCRWLLASIVLPGASSAFEGNWPYSAKCESVCGLSIGGQSGKQGEQELLLRGGEAMSVNFQLETEEQNLVSS